jgi:carboxypeptidase D
MQLLSFLALSGLASSVAARSARYAGKKNFELPRPRFGYPERSRGVKRQEGFIVPQNDVTTKFTVNGTAGAIPYVDFDIGESYAGLLPISSAPNSSELYFWFFPSANPDAGDEITIWLNGGPGCSSLEGFLQENSPISWQYGTYKPVYNPWNWANLTNMVWVEQPVSVVITDPRHPVNDY